MHSECVTMVAHRDTGTIMGQEEPTRAKGHQLAWARLWDISFHHSVLAMFLTLMQIPLSLSVANAFHIDY